MPYCKATILNKWTLDPAVDYAEVLSAYDGGEAKLSIRQRGRLMKDETPYKRYRRTVTTEGIYGWRGDKYGPVEPPRFPPATIARYRNVPFSRIDAIDADSKYVIIAVDDTGDGIPTGFEDMGFDQPMDIEADGTFNAAKLKLRVITNNNVGTDEGDQVRTMLNTFRDNNPGFTPREFARRLRRFIS